MFSDNNKKIDIIKKSFTQLIRQLREAKIEEAKWGGYAWQSEFEMFNEGIKALENILYTSCDDFDFVKELMETEQYFLKSNTLRCFHFPDYKSLIRPDLLSYVTLDVKLDTLTLKAHNLAYRGHNAAVFEARRVVFYLRHFNLLFFVKHELNYESYKQNTLQVINQSRPELGKHRGYKQILGNIVLCILSCGAAFIINKFCTGNFLFFKQTESAKQLEALSQTITMLNH